MLLLFSAMVPVIQAAADDYERNRDRQILRREASALHILLLNEVKQGYDFRTTGRDFYFELSEKETVRIRYQATQLGRSISKNGLSYGGNVILGRDIHDVTFIPDDDQAGITIVVTLKRGDAMMTFRTYWHSRIEQELIEP